MRLAKRNGIAVRGFAVFVAAYCALASGRALVPGLCATLADAKADAAYSCHVPDPNCCHTGDTPSSAAITHGTHACGFCALLHHGVLLESTQAIRMPAFTTPRCLAARDEFVPDPSAFGAGTRRGPPLS